MARILISLLIGAFALGAAGCAARRAGAHGPKAQAAPGRSAAQIRAGFEAEKQRTPHLTMLSEEEAHKALPTMFKRGPMPTLARVGGHQPRTMEAVLGLARAMRQEGDLDEALLNDVFWAVSSANDCFYWMGHVDFIAAVSGLPSTHVFDLEIPGTLDAKRRLAFPFAKKLSRTPETITREDVQALRAEFSEAQIVQLVFAVCHFNTMNRLAHAFGVPLESTNVFAPPPKAKDGPPASPPVPAVRP